MLAFSLLALTACGDSSSRRNNNTVDPEPPPPEPVVMLQQTERIPSEAKPAMTPGSPGVVVENPKLLEHFGGEAPDLNHAIYTRYYLSDADEIQPDAIQLL